MAEHEVMALQLRFAEGSPRKGPSPVAARGRLSAHLLADRVRSDNKKSPLERAFLE